MTLHDVMSKLTGPIIPLGDESCDERRLNNLKSLCELVNELVKDIDDVAQLKDRPEGSIKRAGQYADRFMSETLGIKE